MLIGAHVSASGGLDKALERMQEIGAEAAQIFVQSPRTWRPTKHKPETIERFKSERSRLGAPVFAHALYLVNLASPNEDLYRRSVETMCTTMDVACRIEADGVIFHVGSHQGTGFESAVDRVAAAMEEILEHANDRTWLLMENSAGAGGTIGRSLEELATLYKRLGRHPRLGLCLDSCHLYVSGWDVTERAELDRLVAELDRQIGIDKLRALHVNDAKAPLGSNRDRHENIGQGVMGEKLGVFISHPAFAELPALLETPGSGGHGPGADQVTALRDFYLRWTR
ncbi:MAG TPA: deoxyribonuclease IV [Gaiellaceae bacterium]